MKNPFLDPMGRVVDRLRYLAEGNHYIGPATAADALWLIENGEHYFGTLWREATGADIDAVRRTLKMRADSADGAR